MYLHSVCLLIRTVIDVQEMRMCCTVCLSLHNLQVMKFEPGHPVNTDNFFLPISDRVNRVPLYLQKLFMSTNVTFRARGDQQEVAGLRNF